MKKIKVGLSLSGGIDSSFISLLLKNNNFYIEFFFMNNWNLIKKTRCNNFLDKKNATNLSKNLNIILHFLDFSKNYWNSVFSVFLKDILSNKTPNPDVLCNKEIKFNLLMLYIIKKLNFDFLVTGHYACIKKYKNKIFIYESFDIKKDQTYFLNQIKNTFKNKIIFPISNYLKKNVRKTIKNYLLINFNKKSSSGICFIGENKFITFINNFINKKYGNVLNKYNKIIGYHYGSHFYTSGQKKNIIFSNNIKKINNFYIYKKNLKKNVIFVTEKNDDLLFCKKIIVKNFNFFNEIKNPFLCNVKTKHGIMNIFSILVKKNNKNFYKIIFKKKEKLLSLGQYIVLYKNKKCLGGGYINKILK